LDVAALLATDQAVARRLLRAAVMEVCPEADRIEAAHIDAVLAGVAAGELARDLPGGVHARLEYGRMVLSRKQGEKLISPTLLEVPGSVDLGDAGAIDARLGDAGAVAADPRIATVDAALVTGPLTIDSAHEGDRMRPLGMEGTKKLSDLFIDAKVPRRQRMMTPVVRAAGRIVWVAGVRLADDFRVTDETTRALVLTWRGSERGP
jgi:tRNA(Ile)-lysidine synthase